MVLETTSAGRRNITLLRTARNVVTRRNSTDTRTARPPANFSSTNPGRANHLVPAKIITPDKIPIARELTEGHWLERYITKPAPISSSELGRILETVENTINITLYENGAIPASPNVASEYSDGSWRRDNAIMMIAFMLASSIETETSGDRSDLVQRVKRELTEMAKYDNDPFHRGHFTSFFFLSSDPGENRRQAKEKFVRDIPGLPRAKHSINGNGSLGEYSDWGHHQLDSIGAYLYAYFFAANQGIIDLKELDKILTEQNPENSEDSLFSVALHFLNEIEYWDETDVGPWESVPANKRASSVGMCLAALKEAKKYFDNRSWNPEKIIKVSQGVNLRQIIDKGIENGEAVINERIPSDGRPATETNEIPSDSALAFLLLFNPGLNEAQENAILQRVYENMGEYGIRRMDDQIDAFMGENYALNPNGQGKWSMLHPEHKAAQWTLFDPILATHYYKKYLKSDGRDIESFLLADKHLKRTLSQITKCDYEIEQFVSPHEKITVKIPAGVLPEARWRRKDEHGETWLPNTNSPLQMAHGVFAIMIAEATKAIQLRETGTNLVTAA